MKYQQGSNASVTIRVPITELKNTNIIRNVSYTRYDECECVSNKSFVVSPCMTCHGSGRVDIFNICRGCGGTGIKCHTDCNSCGNTGKVQSTKSVNVSLKPIDVIRNMDNGLVFSGEGKCTGSPTYRPYQ